MKKFNVACDTCPRSRMRGFLTSSRCNKNSFSPFDTRKFAFAAAGAAFADPLPGLAGVGVVVLAMRVLAVQFMIALFPGGLCNGLRRPARCGRCRRHNCGRGNR